MTWLPLWRYGGLGFDQKDLVALPPVCYLRPKKSQDENLQTATLIFHFAPPVLAHEKTDKN